MPLLTRAGVVEAAPSCKGCGGHGRKLRERPGDVLYECLGCGMTFSLPRGLSPSVMEDSNPAPSASAAGNRGRAEGSYAPYGKTQTFRPIFDLRNLPPPLAPLVFQIEISSSCVVTSQTDRQLFGKLNRWIESKRPEEVTPIVLTALLRACAEECPEVMPLLAEWAGFPDRKAVRHG